MTNVCVIGVGNWGKKVLNSIKKIKNIKSKAVFLTDSKTISDFLINRLHSKFMTRIFLFVLVL